MHSHAVTFFYPVVLVVDEDQDIADAWATAYAVHLKAEAALLKGGHDHLLRGKPNPRRVAGS